MMTREWARWVVAAIAAAFVGAVLLGPSDSSAAVACACLSDDGGQCICDGGTNPCGTTTCGFASDGITYCGDCTAPNTCQNGKCVCTPITCADVPNQCGTIPDQCGHTIQCGCGDAGLNCNIPDAGGGGGTTSGPAGAAPLGLRPPFGGTGGGDAGGDAGSDGGGAGICSNCNASNDPCPPDSTVGFPPIVIDLSAPDKAAALACGFITKIPYWPGNADGISLEANIAAQATSKCVKCKTAQMYSTAASLAVKVCGFEVSGAIKGGEEQDLTSCVWCDPNATPQQNICTAPAHETDIKNVSGNVKVTVKNEWDASAWATGWLGKNKVGAWVLDKLKSNCTSSDGSFLKAATFKYAGAGMDYKVTSDKQLPGDPMKNCPPIPPNCWKNSFKGGPIIGGGIEAKTSCTRSRWLKFVLGVKADVSVNFNWKEDHQVGNNPNPTCTQSDCYGINVTGKFIGEFNVAGKAFQIFKGGLKLQVYCNGFVEAQYCLPAGWRGDWDGTCTAIFAEDTQQLN